MSWLYSLLSVLAVSAFSLIGLFFLAFKIERLKKLLLFLVSFAAGGLLGDAFIHLLPEAVKAGEGVGVPLSILSGVLVFFVLEKFISWRHCHVPTTSAHPHPVAVMNLVGDGLHNFIDGMVIAGSYLVSVELGVATSLAVIFHEIPQEIGDFGVLIHGGFTKKKALIFNFISATMAIVGSLLVLLLGTRINMVQDIIIPFTAGGFIYIAGSDLIPEMHKETNAKISLLQFLGLVLGIIVMLALTQLEK